MHASLQSICQPDPADEAPSGDETPRAGQVPRAPLGHADRVDPLLPRVHAAVQLQHRYVVAGGGTYGGGACTYDVCSERYPKNR